MLVLFLTGLAFGFLLAATVGPMWVLCFRRTVEHGALLSILGFAFWQLAQVLR